MTKILFSCLLWLIALAISPIASAQTACTLQYDPVCGTDGVTYGNACTATAAGKTIDYAGTCKTGNEIDQALSMAYQFGITKYNNLTDFRAESLVTREQIAKMMLQFTKATNRKNSTGEFDCGFTDLNTTDPTLTNYITDACKQGMIKWWDNAFHPQNNVSYAQAITMLMRIMDGLKTEPDQRWTLYEQHAITKWYLTQALGQPLDFITRWQLIILMNTIYTIENQADTMYETWDIDDTLATCTWVAVQQCMKISRNGQSKELFYDQIQWFSYSPWYSYTIQVVGKKIDNPPADSSNIIWSLVKLSSYKSTAWYPDTLPQSWCSWTKIDNAALSVRWQNCSTSDWSITITYDNTLPWVILNTKQAQITTSIPIIHLFTSAESTGLQKLLFDTHSSMIKQSLVNKSAQCIFRQYSKWLIWSLYERYDFVNSDPASDNNCGPYSDQWTSENYFIKKKWESTKMIYVNNKAPISTNIERSSLLIK